ncbi:MAG: GNAT family N-acetyltransferase [Candidatus Cloacimonetes bacterium]|nr:GNAT family N-acetyltransferase [Candidatus Cloacimonadota bacterium]
MNKVFKTARCTLRPLSKRDYSDVQIIYSDSTTRLFLGGVIESDEFRVKFENLMSSDDSFHWLVKEVSNGSLIGLVSLSKYHNQEDIEVSYQLLSSQFSKGYAFEVVKVLIDYSFLDLKHKRVLAETQSKNVRSINLLENLGFHLDSKLERFGEEQSIYVLSFQS